MNARMRTCDGDLRDRGVAVVALPVRVPLRVCLEYVDGGGGARGARSFGQCG